MTVGPPPPGQSSQPEHHSLTSHTQSSGRKERAEVMSEKEGERGEGRRGGSGEEEKEGREVSGEEGGGGERSGEEER